VLVAGGVSASGRYLATAELYDPASRTWTTTGSLRGRRCCHTATLLPNGNVLVAGGSRDLPIAGAELYHPVSGTWTAADSLDTARLIHMATLLRNVKVVVAGGEDT